MADRHTNESGTTREREREVIVTDGGHRGGGGLGMVLGVLITIGVLVLLGFPIFGGIFSGGDGGDAGVQVPDEVDINVNDGGEG